MKRTTVSILLLSMLIPMLILAVPYTSSQQPREPLFLLPIESLYVNHLYDAEPLFGYLKRSSMVYNNKVVVLVTVFEDTDRSNTTPITTIIVPVDSDYDGRSDAFRFLEVALHRKDAEIGNVVIHGIALIHRIAAIAWSYAMDSSIHFVLDLVDVEGRILFEYHERVDTPIVGDVSSLNNEFIVAYAEPNSLNIFVVYNYGGVWRKTKVYSYDMGGIVAVRCVCGAKRCVVLSLYEGGHVLEAFFVERVGDELDIERILVRKSSEPIILSRGGYAYTNGVFAFVFNEGKELYVYMYSEDTSYRCSEMISGAGSEPWVLGLNDRFVVAWIDYYRNPDGDPRIANINLSCRITPRYGEDVEKDDRWDHNPLLVYVGGTEVHLFYAKIYKRGAEYFRWLIREAVIDIGSSPEDRPKIKDVRTFIENLYTSPMSQPLHGVAYLERWNVLFVLLYDRDLYRVYGERYYVHHVFLSIRSEPLSRVRDVYLFGFPEDRDRFLDMVRELVKESTRIMVATAYFVEKGEPCSSEFAKILIEAVESGKKVQVVLDDDPRNIPAYRCLREHGVDVGLIEGMPKHIMHHKFIVFCDEKICRHVVVSTANFMEKDLGEDYNLALLLLDAPSAAYFYSREFEQLFNGKFSVDKMDWSFFTIATVDDEADPVLIAGFFSPSNHVLYKLPQIVSFYTWNAEKDIYATFYIFTASRKLKALRLGLEYKLSRLPDVELVFDGSMNLDTLGRVLYELLYYVEGSDRKIAISIDRKMHAKIFVFDRKIVVLGSWNLTKTASELHDENLLLITSTRVGESVAEWIHRIFDSCPRASDRWRPSYPYIAMVSVVSDNEWVKVCNPTDEDVELDNMLIGDEGSLFGGDESLYVFPKDYVLKKHSCIVIAFNGTKFRELYGFYPDFEIVDTTKEVPDMVKVDSRFAGSWNLNDFGDEVLLIYNDSGFLKVVDAVWWCNASASEADYCGWSWYKKGAEDPSDLDMFVVFIKSLDSVYPKNVTSIERITNSPPKLVDLDVALCSVDKLCINRIEIYDPDGDEVKKYVVIDGKEYKVVSLPMEVNLGNLDNVSVVVKLVEHNKIKKAVYRIDTGFVRKIFNITQKISITTLTNTTIHRLRFIPEKPAIEILLSKSSVIKLDVSIPQGYSVKEVYINGTPISNYVFDQSRRILSLTFDPTNITILLQGPQQPQQPRESVAKIGGVPVLGGSAEPITAMYYIVAVLMIISIVCIVLGKFSRR